MRSLCAVAIFVAPLVLPSSSAQADDRPNVVWIVADDLSPELGCYGYEGVETPNIDRLANEGVRYTRAFATAPVCSSSRSAFITGVYQTTTGTHHHRTADKPALRSPIEPLPVLMKRAGYFVSNGNSSMKRAGKSDYNFAFEGKLYDGPDWSKRKKGQSFFAQVQIHEPHRGFVQADPSRRATSMEIPSYYPDHPVIRAEWANYLASIEVLDRHVGAVLERLEREGVADNTVVFFFGDHGRPHYRDKQWLYDGGLRVPLIIRWPGHLKPDSENTQLVTLLDVTATTLSLAGVAVPSWMDGRDMFAKDFKGHQMVFGARDRCGTTNDRIRSVRTERFKYIRNFHPELPYSQHSGYKQLSYPGMTVAQVLEEQGKLKGPPALFWSERRPEEELYDLQADPDEVLNLAGDPGQAETLAQLRGALDQWVQESDDQGRLPEPDNEVVRKMLDASNNWYRRAMKKRGFPPHPDSEAYLDWWKTQLKVD
ncbi:sulfatase [Planctomycetes bacterium Pan216]|uniref:sulfatase family protein n=1 Tax=Kolteria novifilia TaxID=2527975 RepID=UPI0011A5ABBA